MATTPSIILGLSLAALLWTGCVSSAPPPPTPAPGGNAATRPTPTATAAAPAAPTAPRPVAIHSPEITLQIGAMSEPFEMLLNQSATLRSEGRAVPLGPGRYRVEARQSTPARQHWHVFPKTFQPYETQAEAAYLAQWRARGHDPQIRVFGRSFATSSGRSIDNRIHWVSLARFAEEHEANALKAALQKESVWAWVRPETIAPGHATLVIRALDGAGEQSIPAPASLESAGPVQLSDLDRGFWNAKRGAFTAPGTLTLKIGPQGAIELETALPLEDYLRGVLPAEMPASWPAQALQAQAVAARSEALASIHGKHALEGFDFCATEHCRAYGGLASHAPSTDAALRDTVGEILVSENKAVATVYSANCGGWTENNENVWSGPADARLRGRIDGPSVSAGSATDFGLSRFLQAPPQAWCGVDQANFRWNRELSLAEASRLVNQQHKVGTIQRIVPGERGVSGRLRRLTVQGTQGNVTLERELAIRRAFGGLPSALFDVTIDSARGTVNFRGAGRGHGVGMCQHGARGMALAGHSHRDIVLHYFANATMEKVR